MSHDEIKNLLRTNTAVKLVMADNAPLVISFFFKVFKEENRFSIPEDEIATKLDDHLYIINNPEIVYPKAAKSYLTDWSQDGVGFLRKFYESGDEPLYELTAATETALKWIEELNKPEFIGTESRLKLLIDILQELSSKTKQDIYTRIKELENAKAKIEQEIEDAKRGYFDVLDETQVKERFFNAEDTAKRLLSDFRQVEQNFRDIDKDFRRQIITTTKTKGKVLDELFEQQDYLWQTDQGKSFKAFWEFLMSKNKQDEFENLLEEVLNLPQVQKVREQTTTISRIKNNLIEAGDKVNKSTGSLLEQLRKYVEHRTFLENKRIHENITEILKIISENENSFSKNNVFMELDRVIKLEFIIEKPLYSPPQKIKFKALSLEEGKFTQDNNLLYNQFNVNVEELKLNIKNALQHKSQITLKDLVKEHEIKKGVAEVIGYVEVATKSRIHFCNPEVEEELLITNSKTEKVFKVKIPQIIFCK